MVNICFVGVPGSHQKCSASSEAYDSILTISADTNVTVQSGVFVKILLLSVFI